MGGGKRTGGVTGVGGGGGGNPDGPEFWPEKWGDCAKMVMGTVRHGWW